MTGRTIELVPQTKEVRKQGLTLEDDRLTVLKRREGKNRLEQPLSEPASSLGLTPVSDSPKASGLFLCKG